MGCIKLHILDEQYYKTELRISYSKKELTPNFCVENTQKVTRFMYCGGNPVRITDPTGMEWEIDGHCYSPGSRAPANASQNTRDKWNTMNDIYSTKNGKKAIDAMNKEGVLYNVSSEKNLNVTGEHGGSYQTNGDGTGGTIYLNGNDKNMSTLSHEMFHGYQDMHGQGGASIFNEVEAYLFQSSVESQYGYANLTGFPGSNLTGTDASYNHQVNKMTDNYSPAAMSSLVTFFKRDAGANSGGTYNNYPLQRDNQKTSLINGFYPLLPWRK